MCITYIFFHRACKAQGLDRSTLPYYGRFQPYCAWIGLVWMSLIVCTYGYSAYGPGPGGKFSVQNWFIYYAMLILAPILFIGWKLIKRTKFVGAYEADLVWERPTIDAYEATFTSPPVGFWQEMIQLVGLGRRKGGNDVRAASISA